MKKYWLIVLTLIGLSFFQKSFSNPNPYPFTDKLPKMSELIRIVISEFPSVMAAETELKKAHTDSLATHLDRFSGMINHSHHNQDVTENEYNLPSGLAQNTLIQGSITLFDSFATEIRLRMHKYNQEMKENLLKSVQMGLAIEAIKVRQDLSSTINHLINLKSASLAYSSLIENCENEISNVLINRIRGLSHQVTSQITNSEGQLIISGIEFERLTNEPFDFNLAQTIMSEARSTTNTNTSTINYDVLLEKQLHILDQMFSYPKTPEESYAIAQTQAPSLLNAELNEKLSRAGWYLAMASLGPRVKFEVMWNRQHNKQMENDVFSFGPTISLPFSGGNLARISSAKLSERATQYSSETTHRNTLSEIRKLHINIKSIRSQMADLSQALLSIIKGLQSYQTETIECHMTNELNTFLDLLSQLLTIDLEVQRTVNAYLMSKASLLAQLGILLDSIDELEKIEDSSERDSEFK